MHDPHARRRHRPSGDHRGQHLRLRDRRLTAADRVSRTLVAGVGYSDLRDYSVGPELVRRLRQRSWPNGVVVEDLSYDPVKVMHRLAAEEPPFTRLVVAGAVERGRPPGTVLVYAWNHELPGEEEIQDRVAEAVTGVIDLDNLLVVLGALGEPPGEICVVEIEPLVHAMGHEFSEPVAAALKDAQRLIERLAAARPGDHECPLGPLGGPGETDDGTRATRTREG